MNKSTQSTFWKGKSFVASDKAVSAISGNGRGRKAYVGKISGYDGINFRQTPIERRELKHSYFFFFNLTGDGLYEIKNFLSSPTTGGRLWNSYFIIQDNEIREVSLKEAREFALTLMDKKEPTNINILRFYTRDANSVNTTPTSAS